MGTKKRRIRTVTRPAAKGLRIARNSRTSNESLRRMIYNTPKGTHHQGTILPRGTFTIPEDIYSCFILDYFLRGCEVLSSQESSAVNAFEICLKPTPPTNSRHRRRFASAKLAKFSEMAIEYAEKHLIYKASQQSVVSCWEAMGRVTRDYEG